MQITDVIYALLHIDKTLLFILNQYHTWTYLILFLIIFAETGLVVTPFLPGDSLLFVTGSIAGQSQSPLSIYGVLALLTTAAILGNQTNYLLGRFFGRQWIQRQWINDSHIIKTNLFFQQHGNKTLIYARFLPIIRTCAPFLAGISHMQLYSFMVINALSGIIWVFSLTLLGYFLGQIVWIQNHLNLVIYGIIVSTILFSYLSLLFNKKTKENPS
jgi:membrane-associated protein